MLREERQYFPVNSGFPSAFTGPIVCLHSLYPPTQLILPFSRPTPGLPTASNTFGYFKI
jgi:hypothetical protein